MSKTMSLLRNVVKNVVPYGIAKSLFEKPVTINTTEYPEVYNINGDALMHFYLKDELSSHLPYSLMSGRIPKHIIWDRYNHGLRMQMYGHSSIFNRYSKKADTKQFGVVLESEAIIPDVFEMMLKKQKDVRSLDALFTYSEKLLDKFENAKFVIANGVWFGTKLYGGVMSSNNYENKNKLISIVASSKRISPLHVFRADAARKLKEMGIADAMGTAVGAYFDKISDAFEDYMYNVSIENNINKYYFTEKVLDCFASMTIPVYYGATEIGKFFNEDGIIRLKEPTMECLLNTIRQCSKRDYFDRLEAIKDNFIRVQNYLSPDDYIIDNYKTLFR